MCGGTDQRAVSALFRVFGGAGGCCGEEACLHTRFRGMHVGEFHFLAVWVPLSILVALFSALNGWLGTSAAILLAVPAFFAAVNLLPCGLAGRTPLSQWRRWLFAGVLWSVFHLGAGGLTAAIAWGWILLFAANAIACLFLLLDHPFHGAGALGIRCRTLLLVILHLAALTAGWLWGWQWALVGGSFIAALCCLAILRPSCQWLGPVTCGTADRSILITIDDGPDPHDTPLLLDLLDRYGTKAVFFMIGEKAAAHPELVREVIRRGHRIGNHTLSHPQASFWCAGPARTRREIAGCQQILQDITGIAPVLFRAPVGHRNLYTHPITRELGLEVMAWNRRGYDAVETDVTKVLSRLLHGLGPGDIVLVHESTPIAAQVLEGVLEAIR